MPRSIQSYVVSVLADGAIPTLLRCPNLNFCIDYYSWSPLHDALMVVVTSRIFIVHFLVFSVSFDKSGAVTLIFQPSSVRTLQRLTSSVLCER